MFFFGKVVVWWVGGEEEICAVADVFDAGRESGDCGSVAAEGFREAGV